MLKGSTCELQKYEFKVSLVRSQNAYFRNSKPRLSWPSEKVPFAKRSPVAGQNCSIRCLPPNRDKRRRLSRLHAYSDATLKPPLIRRLKVYIKQRCYFTPTFLWGLGPIYEVHIKIFIPQVGIVILLLRDSDLWEYSTLKVVWIEISTGIILEGLVWNETVHVDSLVCNTANYVCNELFLTLNLFYIFDPASQIFSLENIFFKQLPVPHNNFDGIGTFYW